METRRGPERREGRAEEIQETREQRTEVKGERGGWGKASGTHGTRCPERKGRATERSTVEERGGPAGETGRQAGVELSSLC